MTRFCTILILASSFLFCGELAQAQTVELPTPAKNGPKLFTPIKNLRERAANGVLAEAGKGICAKCCLGGKLCPACACKRKEREEKKAKEAEVAERAQEAALKKIEAEAKKAELEAKLLEEQDAERNKPWEVHDDENLESPSELLQLAAQSKQDQDLAPKKQKALDYLASLGCIKDPKVSQAIMKGLKDYNEDVRMAAVQTVLAVVQGPLIVEPEVYNPELTNLHQPVEVVIGDEHVCGCGQCPCCCPKPKEPYDPCKVAKERKERREQRHKNCAIKRLCNACKGKGCRSCNHRGQTVEVYSDRCLDCLDAAPCETCGPGVVGGGVCRACCTVEIVEELEKMAFQRDPKRPDCYYEPSLLVRKLAAEALDLCPKAKSGGGQQQQFVPETGKDKENQGGLIESGRDGNSPTPADRPNGNQGVRSLNQNRGFGTDSVFQSASFQPANERMLNARIIKTFNKGYLIEFSGDYLIPEGNLLYIAIADGSSQVVEVVDAEVGIARVTPVEGEMSLQQNGMIQVGIIQSSH